jgi:hypothetical protein
VKKTPKRLTLMKETLYALRNRSLEEVQGGYPSKMCNGTAECTDSCVVTCLTCGRPSCLC